MNSERLNKILAKIDNHSKQDYYSIYEEIAKSCSDEDEAVGEFLSYLTDKIEYDKNQRIVELNRVAYSTIEELGKLGKYSNLEEIAKHALSVACEVLANNKRKLMVIMYKRLSLKLKFLKATDSEIVELYKNAPLND